MVSLSLTSFLGLLGICSLGLGSIIIPTEEVRHYEGYQVIRTTANTEEQLTLLKDLDDEGTYDFWMGPWKMPGLQSDIMVTMEQKKGLLKAMENVGMEYSIMVEDVERLVTEERVRMENSRKLRQQYNNMTWDEYHTLDEIYRWLDVLAADNPNLVTIETYGTSYEGRELKLIKISSGGNGTKPATLIDAGIHAREWISPAVATYAINNIIYNINNADLQAALDFYIFPVLNPDGYEFTRRTDRMWRKSRSPNNGSTCFGTDINRNFGFMWGLDDEGSSTNPCSQTMRGSSAYSESEAFYLDKYVRDRVNTTRWTAYVTLHSYSQLWMSPYGYSYTEEPEDLAELVEVSDRCVAALTAHHGTRYVTGSASSILYKSNGSSRDWAKGEGFFKWVYTIELRDTGAYGFLLPADQILPTVRETWAGLQVLARHVISSTN